VAAKAGQTAGDILARPQEYRRKVEKQEIHETQVTRELFEDAKIKGKDN
jgi:hypothetical protein